MHIVSNLGALNLHLDQTKCLKSLNHLAEGRGLNSYLPAKNISHHCVATILYVIEGNTLTTFDLQLLEQSKYCHYFHFLQTLENFDGFWIEKFVKSANYVLISYYCELCFLVKILLTEVFVPAKFYRSLCDLQTSPDIPRVHTDFPSNEIKWTLVKDIINLSYATVEDLFDLM